jgi:integrase
MGSVLPVNPDHIFKEAFDIWISNRVMGASALARTHYISERTEWDYRQYARALDKFFIGMRLDEITLDDIRSYERSRAMCEGPWSRECGANRIRKEVSMLVRMLRSAGCWGDEKSENFEPLPTVENDIPRALSHDEQNHWLKTCASRDDFSFIYQYSIAALQTCMSTNEFRALRIGDVSLQQRVVTVGSEGAKNKYRMRTIPLETAQVVSAFEALIWRARKLGAAGPQHYLFPYGGRGGYAYDPSQPMSDSGLRKPWQAVRDESGIDWLRPYDLRHTGVTRLAENGTPVAVMMAFAGHISPKMQRHYTWISVMMRKHAASTWSDSVPAVSSAKGQSAITVHPRIA